MNEFQNRAQNGDGEKSDTSQSIYLTFWVDNQLYGIPIAEVVQIVGVHKIIAMPEYPHYAKGIINLRGSIIPVIDIRIRFHKEEKEYNERTCIIVVNIDNRHVGFIVDAVDEVTIINVEDIAQAPELSLTGSNRTITGIGKLNHKVILLLDAYRIIKSDEIACLYS